jgi:hypothetical protein
MEDLVSRIAAVTFTVCLLAVAAFSQVPAGNAYIGYSYMRADLPGNSTNLNGWNGSVEVKVLPFIGVVADFSGEYGSQSAATTFIPAFNTSIGEHNFLFGPRVSFSVKKFRPFAEVLFGAAHISESGSGFSNSDTSFGDAFGGGIDYHLIPLISWRVEGDDVQTRFASTRQDNLRLSTGIVFHF